MDDQCERYAKKKDFLMLFHKRVCMCKNMGVMGFC